MACLQSVTIRAGDKRREAHNIYSDEPNDNTLLENKPEFISKGKLRQANNCKRRNMATRKSIQASFLLQAILAMS